VERALPLLLTLGLVGCGSGGPSPVLGFDDAGSISSEWLSEDGNSGPPSDGVGLDSVIPTVDATGNPDVPCTPVCSGKQCGNDGCGGICGKCDPGLSCVMSLCVPACDAPSCTLGKMCIDSLNQAALCGGTLDFDHDMSGKKLAIEVNVESLFGAAGVLLATAEAESIVATNPYEVKSQSGNNSCASLDQWNQYWLDDLIIRFVLPQGGEWIQGATHFVSLYIAQTIPGGIRVDYFAPDSPPGVPGSIPFHQQYTQQQGTAYVEFMSPKPVGYVMVSKAQDPDFTIDDLSFGPITAF